MRSTARRALLALSLLAALCVCALAPRDARAEARVYRVQHRPAEELAPLVETLLAGRGSVAVDERTNSLVIVGEPEVLAEVVPLVGQQDRPLPSVVVHYRSQRRSDLEAQGVRIAWRVDAGSLQIGNVILPGDDTRVLVRPEARSDERAGELAGSLRLLPGRSGRIATGSLIPFRVGPPWWEGTELVAVESGFEVTPRLLGDKRVQLELRPFEARPGPGGSVQQFGAETALEVEPGQTVALGGLSRESEGSGRDAFGGVGRERASEERVLLVRVELE